MVVGKFKLKLPCPLCPSPSPWWTHTTHDSPNNENGHDNMRKAGGRGKHLTSFLCAYFMKKMPWNYLDHTIGLSSLDFFYFTCQVKYYGNCGAGKASWFVCMWNPVVVKLCVNADGLLGRTKEWRSTKEKMILI